uniref:Uncharacterized protein n=1 Tax=Candidatus Kentrum sp. LFY TaxID=2126342 RepID=A0A450UYA8_9GAMM|nr:MAG: hypothetical protein BECKLFY1418B_GA0070995_102121 [Candidatus Kentron sp. LFY]VFJ97499.1 MAG: hypothetical protein BECKLFY1418A_GA0070994_10708 [Candidatus Kentron sp. LFY]
MTDPKSLDGVLGRPPDPEDTDSSIHSTILATRQQVQALNRSLMMIGDSLTVASRSLYQQSHALSHKVNQSLEIARGEMRRLFERWEWNMKTISKRTAWIGQGRSRTEKDAIANPSNS